MKRHVLPISMLVLAALCAPWSAPAQDAPQPRREAPQGGGTPSPRYYAAMQAELQALGAGAQCRAHSAQLAHCAFRHTGTGSGRTFAIHLTYDDESDTIYVYVDRFLIAPESAETTPRLLRQLMSVNWDMLIGKFEWDRTDGEVRLSAVMNTDSNFDRRAFRSTVRGIQALADRHYPDLLRIAGPAAAPAGATAGADGGTATTTAPDAGR
ncbi:MAG: YbjN domain-containing protein [Deltaproteobacteria bacterium]|nr:YbjN domain-containing protein [Deltaproteobacteria bacterium]